MNNDKKNNVKVLIGSHALDKSEWIYSYLIESSRKKEDKTKIDLSKKLYLIVPEQDTNEKQRLLMKKVEEKGYGSGIINIDVVSFDRIAHNVFDILNIEPVEEKIIDDDAKTMILVMLLSNLNKEKKISYYSKMANKVGFAKKLTKAMSEFYAYNVLDTDFDNAIEKCKNNQTMIAKLNDFKIIFNEFKNILEKNNYSIKEDKYDKLNKLITTKDNLFDGAIVAFEGFTGFTPVQLDIFKKISNVSSEVYVLIDERFDDEKKKDLNVKLNDTDVFSLSYKFVYNIGKALGVKDLNSFIFDYNGEKLNYKYDNKEDLAFLEKNIYAYKDNHINIIPKNIEVYETKNVEEEITNVAHIILNLLNNDNKLKYDDIRIVVPRVEDYSDKMIKIFDKYKIPLFVDDTKTLLNSPYIETIRAALDVVAYDFSYDSVMRYINSGIIEKNTNINNLDNFIREYGIRGYYRYAYIIDEKTNERTDPGFDSIINYKNEIAKNNAKNDGNNNFDINETKYSNILKVKKEIFDPLCNLYNKISEKKGIKVYVESISEFIREININNRFDSLLYKLADYDNSYSMSREIDVLTTSKQVTLKTISTINSIIGSIDEEISIKDFIKLFDVGFIDKGVKTIPHAIDQVVVGDFMRSRFYNPKIEICMGMNQSSIPASNKDTNLIDDSIRQIFIEIDKELSQKVEETALNQRLYIYLALTNPMEKIILSYSRLNAEGISDNPSSVIEDIRNLFGEYKTDNDNNEKFVSKLDIRRVDKDNLEFFTWDDIINYASINMQDIRKDFREDTKHDIVADVNDISIYDIRKLATKKALRYLYKKDKERLKKDFEDILHTKNYIVQEKLNEKLSKSMFDLTRPNSKGSASSIETYNKCHYQYFLQRMLKLQERKEYEVSSMELGNYVHLVLEKLFNLKKDIASLDDKETKEMIKLSIDEAIRESFNFKELKDDKFEYYGNNKLNVIKDAINNLIVKTVKYIKDIAKKSSFKEHFEEIPFSFKIKLGNEEEIIEGRIDRVEVYKEGDTAYVNVVDYKSGKSKKSFDIAEVNEGVAIQLALYLDVLKNYNDEELNKSEKKIEVLLNAKNIIPCGTFYFWIEDPIIRANNKEDLTDIETEKRKQLSYVGLANEDENVINYIYNGLEAELYQRGANAGRIKDYTDKITGFTIEGEFKDEKGGINTLMNEIHTNIIGAINAIKEGNIDARQNTIKYCKYCPYVNICKKDQIIDEEQSEKDN